MKDIIRDDNEQKGKSVRFNSHNPRELWGIVENVVKSRWQNSESELRLIAYCINEFSEIDPKSTAFRYATFPIKEGKSLRHINLRNLYDQMRKAGNILDGISWGVKSEWDAAGED